jgi:hypothetical protein
MVTGTIYGNNESDPNLKNTAPSGAAMFISPTGVTVEYGTAAVHGTTTVIWLQPTTRLNMQTGYFSHSE